MNDYSEICIALQKQLRNIYELANQSNYDKAMKVMHEKVKPLIGTDDVVGDTKVSKVSVVGVGMRSHVGVASQMFRTLSEENINIQMISTSEIKISVLIDEKYMELAVRALHKGFGLEKGWLAQAK